MLTCVKKKLNGYFTCRAPGCTNRADKNYNSISYNNNNVIITISRHIQNSGIFST